MAEKTRRGTGSRAELCPKRGMQQVHVGFRDRPLRVFPFEQTHLDNPSEISGLNKHRQAGEHAVPKNDKFKNYARYSEYCLNMAAAPTDQNSRSIQREMAVEWLRLADAIRRLVNHPSKL